MNIYDYDGAISQMRKFFQDKKGFTEVPAQSRQSILSACEDPATISQYIFGGINYPLPQTGQMWLEKELLENPTVEGVFCITTSYRNEPNPIAGRHEKIFPMFEFESHGDITDLIKLEEELIVYLGFGKPVELEYEDISSRYQAYILESEHEEEMCKQYGNVISLQEFPTRTHPFWNMEYAGHGKYNKVDVILYGQETIGSAVRSCSPTEMREQFYNISNGEYSNLLFNHFGKKRVEDELNEYLSLDMIPRFGGGIGVTRMIRAMRLLAR